MSEAKQAEVDTEAEVQAPANGVGLPKHFFVARRDASAICDIVLESRHLGVTAAAQKHGLDNATISNWREAVRTEPALNKLFLQKKQQYNNDFSDKTADAINASLDFLIRAARQADPEDKAMVRAVAGGLKMIGEFRLAFDITYASLGRGPSALPSGQSYALEPGDSVLEGKFSEDVQEITEPEEE